MGCNTSNLSRLYNPRPINLTRYNSSLAIRVSHFFFSFQLPVFLFSKTLSLPLQPGFSLSLKLHSLNPIVLPPLSQPPRLLYASPSSPQPLHHRYQHTQPRPVSKNKEKIATHQLKPNPQTPHRALFRPSWERERNAHIGFLAVAFESPTVPSTSVFAVKSTTAHRKL
ncbi:hypothetical protein ACB092_08G005900 [Castanea dentata]